jgi:D-alanyl-D-alanine carboxypeptidase (penicillin-binding protein 5/6)
MRNILILIVIIIFQTAVADATAQKQHASLVVDVNKLKVLHQHNAKVSTYPASLAKLMTLHLIFDRLQAHKITMDTKIKVSKEASEQKPSKLGLKPGETITIRDAINALIIKSANDVAFAVAESLGGGDVHTFVKMMNKKAKALGMRNTNFINPHGWHNAKQYTTAYDMAKLAISLRKHHPKYYKLFANKKFKFKGKTIQTHNRVLLKCSDADGLKTGFTNAAGFNLVTSVKNKKTNIVAVVMGSDSAAERDQKMLNLIDKFSHRKS